MDQAGFGTEAGGTFRFRHVTSEVAISLGNGHKKTGLEKPPQAGITLSPACLATYLTWLQAGRLKSPRDNWS